MSLRQILRHSAVAAAVCTAAIAFAGPALAQGGPYGDYPPPGEYRDYDPRTHEAAREAWLADCRHRLGRRDSGLGGAVIGGVVVRVAGNHIAGRGNRTAGTVAGAAIGAGAGMAIDRAEDRGRVRDECEAYLADYEARYSHGRNGYGHGYPDNGYAYRNGYGGHANGGYGHGYPAYGYGGGCCMPMMMVPIMHVPKGEPECTETVEYVYEDVPVRRAAPRKRVKVVPDKRIKTVPVK